MDSIPQDIPQDKPVYIYTLSSPSDPKNIRYVGKTTNPKRRLEGHMCDKKPTHRSSWLSSLRAQGLRPLMTIIEITTSDKWEEREIFWVAFYRNHGFDLVNSTDGGNGFDPSPEIRAKMSVAAKARRRRPLSEETKRKIGIANQGRKVSDEARARSSASHMGKPSPRRGKTCSPESRAKMSLVKRGKPLSPEAKARFLANMSSPEAKAKVSASRRGKKQSPETIAKRVAGTKRARALKRNPPNAPTLWD